MRLTQVAFCQFPTVPGSHLANQLNSSSFLFKKINTKKDETICFLWHLREWFTLTQENPRRVITDYTSKSSMYKTKQMHLVLHWYELEVFTVCAPKYFKPGHTGQKSSEHTPEQLGLYSSILWFCSTTTLRILISYSLPDLIQYNL